jgi:hypothetical protein
MATMLDATPDDRSGVTARAHIRRATERGSALRPLTLYSQSTTKPVATVTTKFPHIAGAGCERHPTRVRVAPWS